jgi:hypothetical protein
MSVQSEEAPICSLDSSLYFQTHVICWCFRDPRYTISAPLLFFHGSANQCQLYHLSNRSSVLQNVLFISSALGFCWLIVPRIGSTHSLWCEQSSNVIQALVKFTRVLNTPMSLNLDRSFFVELICLFLNKRLSFVQVVCKHFWFLWYCFG